MLFALNAPASWFNVKQFLPQKQVFGNISLTTLQGTDNLTNFPTTYNANNLALNNGKIDVGSTSIASVTSLPNLSTVGTVGTGIWTASAVGAPYGGTGSTTLSQYQVLLGNGAGNITTPVGWGTSGQFLTSNGGGVLPSWQSSTVNQAANYLWTGTHIFTGTTFIKNFIASSTLIINNGGAGVAYAFPTSNSGGFLKNDGAGNLTWSTTGLTAAVASSTTFAAPTSNGVPTGASVICVSPKIVSGGGLSGVPGGTAGSVGSITTDVTIANYPSATNTWTVTVLCLATNSQSCSSGTITAYAMCVNP